MAWKTLYVTGRSGFDRELFYFFERSGVDFLTGSFNTDCTYLFWITDSFVLKDFKRTIGSKIVFKYRMRFFFAHDAFVSAEENGKKGHRFTSAQEQMFRELDN